MAFQTCAMGAGHDCQRFVYYTVIRWTDTSSIILIVTATGKTGFREMRWRRLWPLGIYDQHCIAFLTFRHRLPVQRHFHRSLSVAHSSLMFQAFGYLLTVSFHLNFDLPLGRFPSIFISTTAWMFSVSSLLLTCPNHSSLLLLITIAIGSTFASSKISLFIRFCNRPIAPFSTSVVVIRFSSLTGIGHASEP